MPDTSLVAEFRARARDVRASQRAFGLAVVDSTVTSAVVEITNGRLLVTVTGSPSCPSVDVSLSDPRYATIGDLLNALGRSPGYRVARDEGVNMGHASVDLDLQGPAECQGTGVDLFHHMFSDLELEAILRRAIQRHNPSLNLVTIPPQEVEFALQMAMAILHREQATDAVKRKGLDMGVGELLQLADSYERAYNEDTKRLKRAIQSPKEANPNTMREGDITLGTLSRRSLRTGYIAPVGANLPPDAPVLLDPSDLDQEDDNVRVQWQRNHNADFYSYELWMDTQPEVQRTKEGQLFAASPWSSRPANSGARITTSKMVFRSLGPNSSSAGYVTFITELGQAVKGFIVNGLEPENDYFFRLYVIDLNNESAASNVVRLRTVPMRAVLKENDFASSLYALPGTVVTLYMRSDRGTFTAQHRVFFGGQEVTATIVGPYEVTVVVPTFMHRETKKDLVVRSPTGLTSVMREVFQVAL